MSYNHTQTGKWIIYFTIAMALYLTFVWVQTGFDKSTFYISIIAIFMLLSFKSLTISIDKENIQIKFGFGIFKKYYLLKEITSVKIVKNKWYYGLGIKYFAPKQMWIYSISGLDAVEITLKNKSIKRIGTDETKKLERAIKQAIK